MKLEELLDRELQVVEAAFAAGMSGSKFVARSAKQEDAEEEEENIDGEQASLERKNKEKSPKGVSMSAHNQAVFDKVQAQVDKQEKEDNQSHLHKLANKVIHHFQNKPAAK